ncbi:MAG: D-alanyl-D-alanine carboxypeptidase [Leptolyngbya sp. SIO4C1]|nr:D-alanyl-D-alanine carboxypeptidase [Leptolyngbya sp. SIO4C1]
MPQVSLSISTTFDGDLNALIEDQGTALTVRFDLDEPAPEGGLKVYVDSEIEQIINRLDLPGFAASPILENIELASFVTNFDNSGFALTIDEGAIFGSFTLNVFDNSEPDTFLPETFDGRVEAALSLRTQDEVDSADQGDISDISNYTIDPNAASSTVIFADDASQLTDTSEPPTEPPTEPPASDALQVSLFTGPDYLIEDEGTVSAHAFNVTNGTISEGGLVVSVDAPNLGEFDLDSVSVEGGEIEAVRDGGFDLRMTQYTTLVNLPIADDGETESGETATFSLAEGEGYEIISDYSSGTFNLVDTEADIPLGVVTEPNQTIPIATDTQISPENPTFSGSDSIYFDIGNRLLNSNGIYEYIDYSEDVDVYKINLKAEDTVAIETFDSEANFDPFGTGLTLQTLIYDAEGNPVLDYEISDFATPAAPDKLFGGTGPFDENETNTYLEFTAPEDGDYYVAFGLDGNIQLQNSSDGGDPIYDPLVFGSGNGNRTGYGDYSIEVNLLSDENPRETGTPTPPVSNPNVTNPPTLSLSANATTTDSEGNLINGVVEYLEPGEESTSGVNFTIQTEGEIPEEGIEVVLNSDANLFDYVSLLGQNSLPSTIGGQSLGAFYNEEGIPTGIRLRIEEPIMTVNYEAASIRSFFDSFGNIAEAFQPLETDGAEDVTFFLQPGEGYEVASDAVETEVTYYDSIEDVPASTGGSDTIPEVGVTVSETELIETEGTETTLTFNLSEPPPPEGVTVFLDSEDEPLVGSVLGQFDVLNAEIIGGNFPVPNGDESGFFFTITEQTATITLSVFDELTAGIELPPDTFQEGVLALNFALQPQESYTIDEDASEINLRILDNPDSQIQVGLTGSIQTDEEESDEESTNLIEAEGTVSVHTFSLSAPPPEGGLTVSVSADSLNDFNLDNLEVQGGTIANLQDDGFDLTITEQDATISLPVLEDGTDEGRETATFILEPGDTYQINPAATEATFNLADTLDQVAVSEEVESNSTLSEANVLGLGSDTPSISISGVINEGSFDLPEDVDFYSFDLEAGQTVNLDIDTEEILPNTVDFRPVVSPALAETLQKPDTELRLFDAEGNELAANSDGAAPDEEFSRDPYIEFTAESAGTFYVGVSQLGNRNYDPSTANSGSGWTFPEVGVFFGPYELTATLTDGDPQPPTGGDLIGTPGDDTLEGTAEADTVAGDLGNDIITGGDGDDILRGDLNTRDPQDTVMGGNDIIFGGDGNDRIGGKSGNDILSGDAGDDFIYGDAGDDIIMGVTGNDILVGDNGSGGSGSDLFVFGNGDGTDIILDFEVGIDRIGLVEDELVFADLTLTQDRANTLLGVGSETLAVLNNVMASTLSESDFTSVADVSNVEEALALV